MRVADFIADFIFEELNVKHVFMVTGAGIMHLTDGVASHPKLQAICPHHEQTSSMAIDAYSRASENFGVGFFNICLFPMYRGFKIAVFGVENCIFCYYSVQNLKKYVMS